MSDTAAPALDSDPFLPTPPSAPTDGSTPAPRPGWLRTVLPAAAVVVLGDQLVAAAPDPGWTLGVPPLCGLLLVCWRHPALLRQRLPLAVAGATLLACLLPLYDAGVLAPFLGLCGVALLALLAAGWTWAGVPAALKALIGSGVRLPVAAVGDAGDLVRAGPSVTGLARHAWGWVLPLAAVAVFTGLFAAANPIFQGWLADLGNLVERIFGAWWAWLPGFGRLVAIALLAAGAWWALRATFRPAMVRTIATAPRDRSAAAVRLLATCNLLFLTQTGLDAWYLWGRAALPAGTTWSGYAHHGAWALMFAVLLSAALVLWAFPTPGVPTPGVPTPGAVAPATDSTTTSAASRLSTAARWLVGLWLAQNALLVLGAVRRLALYMDVYGLSNFRLAAALWMVLVGVGVALLLWRILARRSNRWLIDANAVATVLALFVAAVDWDGLIAWHNVRNCRETTRAGEPLDVEYLQELGPGAVPAMRWYLAQPGATHRDDVQHAVDDLTADARRVLYDWRGYTLVRAAAAHEGRYVAEPVRAMDYRE